MKHSRLVGLFVALLGVLALFSSLNKPGVAALRGSEVLGLIGSGRCFGVDSRLGHDSRRLASRIERVPASSAVLIGMTLLLPATRTLTQRSPLVAGDRPS